MYKPSVLDAARLIKMLRIVTSPFCVQREREREHQWEAEESQAVFEEDPLSLMKGQGP